MYSDQLSTHRHTDTRTLGLVGLRLRSQKYYIKHILRFMKNGDLFLENSLINIDGDSEIGDKSLKCHTIFLKGKMNIFSFLIKKSFILSPHTDCDVNIRNISIESGAEMKDGRCLDLENCSNFVIINCKLSCQSDTSDLSPYPNRYYSE